MDDLLQDAYERYPGRLHVVNDNDGDIGFCSDEGPPYFFCVAGNVKETSDETRTLPSVEFLVEAWNYCHERGCRTAQDIIELVDGDPTGDV